MNSYGDPLLTVGSNSADLLVGPGGGPSNFHGQAHCGRTDAEPVAFARPGPLV